MSWFGDKVAKIFPNTINSRVEAQARDIAGHHIEKMKASLGYTIYGGGSTGGSKYRNGIPRSGGSTLLLHRTIRRNARTAVFDSTAARGLIVRLADSVADTGLRLEATPNARLLNITDEQAELWAADVEERFNLWADSKLQHRSGEMSFYQSHRFYQMGQHRDGEMFVRLYYSKDTRLQNPLQFEFLDPDQIFGDEVTSTTGSQFARLSQGIERNAKGETIAYKVLVRDEKGQTKAVKIPVLTRKRGRLNMLHGFVPEYAGQRRGYSALAHVLQELHLMTNYSLAEVAKAVNQSNINLFVKPSDKNPSSDPFEGGGMGGGVRVKPAIGDPGESGTTTEQGPYDPVQQCNYPDVNLNKPGSMNVTGLKEGEELKAFASTAPSASYDKFQSAFIGSVSQSLGVPPEVLAMSFNQNYSASRASLIMFWRVTNIWREEMGSDYLNPIYEMWLSGEIAAGRIQAMGWSDPRIKRAWLNSRWIGVPMPNIDPMRTAMADQTYIGMGAQTGSRAARNLNGSDFKANKRKIKKEYEGFPEMPWKKTGGR